LYILSNRDIRQYNFVESPGGSALMLSLFLKTDLKTYLYNFFIIFLLIILALSQ